MDYPRDQEGFSRQGSKRPGEDYPGADKRVRNTPDGYTHVAPHRDYGTHPEYHAGNVQQQRTANHPGLSQQQFASAHMSPFSHNSFMPSNGYMTPNSYMPQNGYIPSNGYMPSNRSFMPAHSSFVSAQETPVPPQTMQARHAQAPRWSAESTMGANSNTIRSSGRSVNGGKTTPHPVTPAANPVRPASRAHQSGIQQRRANFPQPPRAPEVARALPGPAPTAQRQGLTPHVRSIRRNVPAPSNMPTQNRILLDREGRPIRNLGPVNAPTQNHAPIPPQASAQNPLPLNPEQQGVEDPWEEVLLYQINNPLTELPGIDQDIIMPKPEDRNPILPYDILLARYLPAKQRYKEYAVYQKISIAAYGPFDQYRKEAKITLGIISNRIQNAEWRQLGLWVKEGIFNQMIEQPHFTEPKTLHMLGIPEQVCAIHLKDIDFERDIKPIFDFRQPLLNAEKPQLPQPGHPMNPGHGQTFAHSLSSEQSGRTGFEPVQEPLGRPPVLNNADNPIVIGDEDDEPVQAATVHQSQGLNPGVKRRLTAAPSASPKRPRLESYEPRNDSIRLDNSGNANAPLQVQGFIPAQASLPVQNASPVQASAPVEATPIVATDNAAPAQAAASVQDDAATTLQDVAPAQATSPAQAPSTNEEATVSKKPSPVSKEEKEDMERWMQTWEEDRNLAMNVFKGRPGFMNGPLSARFNRGDFKYKNAALAYTYCLAPQVAAEQQKKAEYERTAKLKADSRAREKVKKEAKRREALGLPEPEESADKGDAESEPKDDSPRAIIQAPEEDTGEDEAAPQAPQEAELEDAFSRAMMEAFDNVPDDAEAEPQVPQEPTLLSEPAASPEPTPDPEPTAAIAPQDDHNSSSTKEDEAIVAPSPSISGDDENSPLGNDREASPEPLPVTADDEVIVEASQSAGNDHHRSLSEDGNQILENVEAQRPVQDEAIVEPSPSRDDQTVTEPSTLLEEDDMNSLFGDDEEMPDTPPTSKEKTYQPVLEEPAAPPSPSPPPALKPHEFGVVDENGAIEFTADGPLEERLGDVSDHETDDESGEESDGESDGESDEESDEEVPPEVQQKNREIAEVDAKIATAQEKFNNTTNKIWQRRLQAEIDRLSQEKIALNAELGELTGL